MSTQIVLSRIVTVKTLDENIWLDNTIHDTENMKCAVTTVHFASPEQAREVALKLIAAVDALDEVHVEEACL